ncbi:DNA-binding transcriptional LysR family regulator [Deinobacterium chartae]|uniref:DNA-binding transcriptional LysR family regulator n=1 Tax=Deinobacterium chartae TaxID=521158 RepID=A0A841HXU8_9DEIO|nr:LysR family transcriptional regulator [Deinobacterium chartae]MBB6096752.1 DNA-binding transcriptional LysR family regulator [Deinobacterium chartae]
MALNPDHLLTFARVARHGSLSAAAAELHLTQPAISSQLRLLTRAVGEPLFTRHRYGIALTATGQELLPHALAVARALEGAQRYVSDLRALTHGSLNIAASTTNAASILPGVLTHYHALHPGVSFRIRQGNTQEALEELRQGHAEVALIEGPPGPLDAGLSAQVFRQDELLLVAAPQHPLAHSAGPLDLTGLGLVWREAGSGTRVVAEQALRAAGVPTRTLLELTGTEAVKEAVISGLGAAFLSDLSVRRELRSGLLVRLPHPLPALRRDLRWVAPHEEQLSRAARTFLELLHAGGGPHTDSPPFLVSDKVTTTETT